MYLFDRDIAMEYSGKSNFEGIVSPNWSVNGNPNGGYLMAFLASAMQIKSDKKWPVIVTANFLTKCETGKKSRVKMESISAGKQLTRCQASLIQDGTETTRCWATFMDEGYGDKRANRCMKKKHAEEACLNRT
ncbi:MAG: acyl-CoA thioesterase domain-containing protein [Syntrophales bacterium]